MRQIYGREYCTIRRYDTIGQTFWLSYERSSLVAQAVGSAPESRVREMHMAGPGTSLWPLFHKGGVYRAMKARRRASRFALCH